MRLDAADVGMFRFLLEAYENLAIFSVLEKRPALLKLMYASESRGEVIAALEEIGKSIRLCWEEWPL